MGFSRAALFAGYNPKITPRIAEKVKAITRISHKIITGQPPNLDAASAPGDTRSHPDDAAYEYIRQL
ncbi:MAG TPA: hypothetical protein VI584_00750 [Nitrospiria bacterium]|nr:hypothetical protein [Nitrospiria bacterium]